MEPVIALTAAMARAGIRRLLVLAGESEWSNATVMQLTGALPARWLWVGENPLFDLYSPASSVRTLLGREFDHTVFDARQGLDVEALAVVAGTLKAGSWLVLLTPPWEQWPQQPDADSRRWADSPSTIATPHFISRLQRVFTQDGEVVCWHQHQPVDFTPSLPRPDWHPANGAPLRQQAEILHALQSIQRGVAVVTAPRGRGKSALAGMLIAACTGNCIVTAPSRAATDVLAEYAADKFHFLAPDALHETIHTAQAPQADWLVIDEAAAIPGPLLSALIAAWPRVLLVTTIQGYEGTGRGFMLKFCAGVPGIRQFALSHPIRWADNDPLERVLDTLLLFKDEDFARAPQGDVQFSALEQAQWDTEPAQMASVYQLLCGAHYRTSPLDLRRMMDAPGQQIIAGTADDKTAAALWLLEEGGLSPALSQAVWAGYRRPRGNLVAQSLAAHGGDPFAATLKGLRVSRIAVHPARQREGLGQALIRWARHHHARDVDYLSVSFGYTETLWRFWQRCGFTLARIGSHREASSGCYNAIALLPLTPAGAALVSHERARLERDAPFLQAWIAEKLPVQGVMATTLNDDDWRELAGFAFAHRPLETCLGSLNRLVIASPQSLPALRGRLDVRQSVSSLCQALRLSGRKALLARCRQEASQALYQLDPAQHDALKNQVLQLQFFH
ncbi:tRNA(Met) cytidine acetyltransferase TmcA [Atlantibacter subterraneus]|uniref:tRNA(Met) cytidine acetyltransferase TmcA n=1 Tax=Atlantibacter subterraneus TaxID=255519 RepID=UPI002963E68A|nr:GNAT family N-acetyltransferase [Atlantibacter subterranea]MDW2743726.1 GNAT family N-acetyltransferase [Atlantibacter subterranea]